MTDTEELERLSASITQGTWRKYGKNTGKVISEGPEVGTVEICETGDFCDAELVPFNADRWNSDADAIAIVPDLLAEVIALRADVERLRAHIVNLRTAWTLGDLQTSDFENALKRKDGEG